MQIIAFIILISILIFAHEFGHFIFAKLFGVKVHKFSIGMGPEIIKYQGKETKYVISILPIGGFVSMLGHDPTIEVTEEDEDRSLGSKPAWQRFIIMFAGPAFNLLLPFLLYFIYAVFETTHLAPVIGQVSQNGPAYEAGIRAGDQILKIGDQNIYYWRDLSREITKYPGKAVQIKLKRGDKIFTKAVIPRKEENRDKVKLTEYVGKVGITPYLDGTTVFFKEGSFGKLKNFDIIKKVDKKEIKSLNSLKDTIFKTDKDSVNLTILRPISLNIPLLDLFYMEEINISEISKDFINKMVKSEMGIWWVHPGSVADKAGFKKGDYILSADGKKYNNWVFLQSYLTKQKDEKNVTFSILRDQKVIEISLKQELIKSDSVTSSSYFELGIVPFIVKQNSVLIPFVQSERVFMDSIEESYRNTTEMIQLVFTAVVQLFSGELSFKHLGGPIMMYEASGIALAYGWLALLKLMAILSINLGLLNLLPIPMLDGGHILFIIAEIIRRKPVNQRFKEIASFVGLILLILVMILVFKNDIENFIF